MITLPALPPDANPSYVTGVKCCGADCWAFEAGYGPCWGPTYACDEDGGEDYYWIHTCEGHEALYYAQQDPAYWTGSRDPMVHYTPEPNSC